MTTEAEVTELQLQGNDAKNSNNHQKLERGKKGSFPFKFQRERDPTLTLDF